MHQQVPITEAEGVTTPTTAVLERDCISFQELCMN